MLSAGAAIALAGVLGLLVGSFLNVVILRLPARLMHDWRQQSRELLELDPDGICRRRRGSFVNRRTARTASIHWVRLTIFLC